MCYGILSGGFIREKTELSENKQIENTLRFMHDEN